jgi:hypothetical protein
MRKIFAFPVFVLFGVAFGQNVPTEKVTVKFSDPSKPGVLEANLMNGGISVEGYAGSEVVIEAVARTQKVSEDAREHDFEYEEENEENGENKNRDVSTRGLRKLSVTTTGLEVVEESNRMQVSVSSWMRTIDLKIKVPRKTSLELSTINSGNVEVTNVDGEVEVSNMNGKIKLANVGGTVVANATNGDVTVSLARVDAGKAMSFVSMNGDLDVTLPASTKALLKMKTEHGDIYSDFEITFDQQRRVRQEDNRNKGGRYELQIENVMLGSINGGGPEFRLETFNGNIYVRKMQAN